ncbi:MAG: hypothetical protein DMD54_02675 [Gemmatimonadetes bacterium]|nr:MAG: hypothetical protein DMD54_02675 [Gemmatimonadota bacterium]
MKRSILATLVMSSFLVSTGRAQVGGSGTPNTIPQFTTSTTIGDSPMIQFGGNIGIGTTFPTAKLTVRDVRDVDISGNGPSAINAIVSCKLNNFCAAVRGDADATSVGAHGVVGINHADNEAGGGGVLGITSGTKGFIWGVRGDANGTTGNGVGVFGQTFSGEGIAGLFINRHHGNILVGNVGETDTTVFRVDGSGRVFANGGFRPFGADFAEAMAVRGDRSRYEPGDLLVIDPVHEDRLTLSERPYSSLVAGIYSTRPGVVASQHRMDDPALRNEVPLAVVGIVPCKVTAENGPIAIGDLLVTSSTLGRAMKGTDRARMFGAVVGKALEPLTKGTGVIQVLVTLQ